VTTEEHPKPGIRQANEAVGAIGHEFIGVVEGIGPGVEKVRKGDFVIAPLRSATTPAPTARPGTTGRRNPRSRAPGPYDDAQLASLLALSDVLGTGYHAAVSAEEKPGDTVAVVGDGAVGLCGIIAAKLLEAKHILALSRHPARQALAREFGATTLVEDRGASVVPKVFDLDDIQQAYEAMDERRAVTS
jgi:alcohol dehydrogenase